MNYKKSGYNETEYKEMEHKEMEHKEMELKEMDFAEMLWNYFSLHSNQRIQLINFYIILETFLFAGLFSLLTSENDTTIFCILISFASLFFSFLFWNLDVRTKQMIKECEECIKHLENNYNQKYGEEIMIFLKEEKNTKVRKFPLSYAKAFFLLFIFFSLIGFSCMLLFIFQLIF